MLRRLRRYEFGPWTVCDALATCAAVCLLLFACTGCDELTVVLGGGNPNPVYVNPVYTPPIYAVDPCHGGCGYDDGYYDDGYYDDDFLVIDVGVGW